MYILNDDNINNICIFIDKHSDLCLLKLVNKNLNNISEKRRENNWFNSNKNTK